MMLEEMASFMHFEDGDVIMGGMRKGVAAFNVGDRFVGRVYCGERALVEKERVVQ